MGELIELVINQDPDIFFERHAIRMFNAVGNNLLTGLVSGDNDFFLINYRWMGEHSFVIQIAFDMRSNTMWIRRFFINAWQDWGTISY